MCWCVRVAARARACAAHWRDCLLIRRHTPNSPSRWPRSASADRKRRWCIMLYYRGERSVKARDPPSLALFIIRVSYIPRYRNVTDTPREISVYGLARFFDPFHIRITRSRKHTHARYHLATSGESHSHTSQDWSEQDWSEPGRDMVEIRIRYSSVECGASVADFGTKYKSRRINQSRAYEMQYGVHYWTRFVWFISLSYASYGYTGYYTNVPIDWCARNI